MYREVKKTQTRGQASNNAGGEQKAGGGTGTTRTQRANTRERERERKERK
jgi:hypothetical protein